MTFTSTPSETIINLAGLQREEGQETSETVRGVIPKPVLTINL
jgi:hypothetical protein